MYKDLMIDLETLDTTPKAVVLSIGAVFFDINRGVMGPTYYQVLEIEPQLEQGRLISEQTLNWWEKQNKEAKDAIDNAKKFSPKIALSSFNEWIKENSKNPHPWGNGSSFDISILESLFLDFNIKTPWRPWFVMDLRTFRRFCAGNKKVPRSQGTYHNALDDAINQAQFVMDNSVAFNE